MTTETQTVMMIMVLLWTVIIILDTAVCGILHLVSGIGNSRPGLPAHPLRTYARHAAIDFRFFPEQTDVPSISRTLLMLCRMP